MATPIQIFRRCVLSEITPVIADAGFERWKPDGGDEVATVYFRRHQGAAIHLCEIQFEKHKRWGFFVCLASFIGNEVETMFEGLMPAAHITTAHLRERCRLLGNARSGAFKPSLVARLRGPEPSASQVAALVHSRFPEAMGWFSDRLSGPHIRVYTLDWTI